MENRLLIGGSGGQGVMLLGTLLATAAIKENKYSSCLPSYGPEMRGGTANCTIVISENRIITPSPDEIDCIIALNQPSYDKFKSSVKKGGTLIINSSIVVENDTPRELDVLSVPCNDIAHDVGSVKAANMVALGAYLERVGAVKLESVMEVLREHFEGKESIIKMNNNAILCGMKTVEL